MRRTPPPPDPDTAERILSGLVAEDDAPPGYGPVVAALARLRAAFRRDGRELPEDLLVRMRAALDESSGNESSGDAEQRHPHHGRRFASATAIWLVAVSSTVTLAGALIGPAALPHGNEGGNAHRTHPATTIAVTHVQPPNPSAVPARSTARTGEEPRPTEAPTRATSPAEPDAIPAQAAAETPAGTAGATRPAAIARPAPPAKSADPRPDRPATPNGPPSTTPSHPPAGNDQHRDKPPNNGGDNRGNDHDGSHDNGNHGDGNRGIAEHHDATGNPSHGGPPVRPVKE